MGDEVHDKVLGLISRMVCAKNPIPLSASINHDLRIDGDDAYELLVDIKKNFDVNFDAMDFHRYFHDEPDCGPLLYLWARLPWTKKEVRRDNLTVRHLIEVAKAGVWFD